MATQIHTITTYTIESHPNKESVFDWIRANWHDLAYHCIGEMADSLKGFADHVGASLDFSLSTVPDRGEHVTLRHNELDDLSDVQLYKNWNIDKDLLSGTCPFTGMVYDEVILDAIREKKTGNTFRDIMDDVEYRVKKCLHDEGEYLYSDEALQEMCEANEYYFNEDGSIA
jgi:hypothetical protein